MNINNILRLLIISITLCLSNISFAEEEPGYFEGADPDGYLFNKLTNGWLVEHGFRLRGWLQISALYNDHEGKDQLITGSFHHDEGVTLSQVGLKLEKVPKSNVIGRVGPFPGPKPESFDWGITVTATYGTDALFFKTAGLDDEWDFDQDDEKKLAFNEFFVELYLPFLDGTDLMFGSFHTPLSNEIGFPFDPPNTFNTHSMAFLHGPAKHFGLLVQSKLPIDPKYGLLSLELGAVNGWSNLENQNNDLNAIYAVRWRSEDFRTWIDLEGIYGNGENDQGGLPGTPQGSSPYLAISTTSESLLRVQHNLTVTHVFNPKWSMLFDASYGTHEAATNSAIPFGVTEDSEWYGITGALMYQYHPDMKFGLRGEWFKDDDGAHAWWQAFDPVTGSVTKYDDHIFSLTANLTWTPKKFIRIRPEIRYDWSSGDSTPFAKVGSKVSSVNGAKSDGGFLPGTKDSQIVGGMDVTIFF